MHYILLTCVIIIIFLFMLLMITISKNHALNKEKVNLSTAFYHEKNNYNREIEILKWNYLLEKQVFNNIDIIKYKPSRDLKILVADYYKISASITNETLLHLGIIAEFVFSGEDVIKKIEKNNYDVIITNSILKGNLDGVMLLNKLRETKNFATPVIILTASRNNKKYYVDECHFDDYIEKTLDDEKAIISLKKLIPNLTFTKIKKIM